ncbi:hypothetical protein B0H14DRAFT_3506881 [Mycena olivaceomarginata]|nr:hypothetical protein B0H14DRAFT_3506881 [Mycena olivaceomarginata]
MAPPPPLPRPPNLLPFLEQAPEAYLDVRLRCRGPHTTRGSGATGEKLVRYATNSSSSTLTSAPDNVTFKTDSEDYGSEVRNIDAPEWEMGKKAHGWSDITR